MKKNITIVKMVIVYLILVGVSIGGEGTKVEVQRTHIAFASDIDYLDGLSLEALGNGNGNGALPTTDREGNLYLIWKYATRRIRCVRVDGIVETIAGDDRWPGNLGLTEGPAAYFPCWAMPPQAGGYSIPGAIITVSGLPLKGEDQGCIYFYWPRQSPYKIYKSKEKKGRWWFKRIGAPDKSNPPTSAGQIAKLDETNLTDARIANGFIVWKGNVYEFDEAKGEMKCLFTLQDYISKVESVLTNWSGKRPGVSLGAPEHIERTSDGNFFLSYFWKTYPAGNIFKISPDGKQLEHIVKDISWEVKGTGVGANRDGDGLTTTWHCGPADISTCGNVLFLHAIDSVVVRRWMNGRVSTLCFDGEWRETPRGRGIPGWVAGKHYQPGQGNPKYNYIYITYPGEENGGDIRVYRFGPIDFTKPTVGPLTEPLQQIKKEGETQK